MSVIDSWNELTLNHFQILEEYLAWLLRSVRKVPQLAGMKSGFSQEVYYGFYKSRLVLDKDPGLNRWFFYTKMPEQAVTKYHDFLLNKGYGVYCSLPGEIVYRRAHERIS